jgi:hypothetical protein
MAITISGETKREAQRKAKRQIAHKNKKKLKKISASCGRKLSYPQRL